MAASDLAGLALSWHQFDRMTRFVNEANPGTHDLAQAATTAAAAAADAAGVEYQLEFVSGDDDALYISGSNAISAGFKKTASEGAGTCFYMHATFGSGNGSGTLPMFGRYTGGANQLRATLTSGAVAFQLVDSAGNPQTNTGYSPADGERVHIFAQYTNETSLDAGDGLVEVYVYSDAGVLLASDTLPMANLTANSSAETEIHLCGQSRASTTCPNLSCHVFAAFDRALDTTEREWLVNTGAGRRWWDIKRQDLVGGGETFSTPVSGDHHGNLSAIGGMFDEHRQIIALSDSYGWLVNNGGRPIAALPQAAAFNRWAAVSLPYDNPSMFGVFRANTTAGLATANINDTNNYETEGGAAAYAATPYHGVSAVIGSGFVADTTLFTVEADRTATVDGETGTFEDAAHQDYAAFVSYVWPGVATPYSSIEVAGQAADLSAGAIAGQAASTPLIDIGDYNAGTPIGFDIVGPTAPGADQSLDIIDVTLVKTDGGGSPVTGTYLCTLADNSWGWSGYGANTASSGGGKTVSTLQVQHWLDAHSIDDAQGITVVGYMDLEPVSQATHYTRIKGVIDEWTAAHAASSRTGSITFLAVVPPCIATDGSGADSVDSVKMHAYEMRKACEQLATEYPEQFAWASIPEFTEYQHWTSTDPNSDPVFDLQDDSGSDWLAANGFATIDYGTNAGSFLATTNGSTPRDLMSDGGHPDVEVGNVFFWQIVTDAVPAGSGLTPGLNQRPNTYLMGFD